MRRGLMALLVLARRAALLRVAPLRRAPSPALGQVRHSSSAVVATATREAAADEGLVPISSYFALPAGPRRALEEAGWSVAAPIQSACWRGSPGAVGAAAGESVCVHAPTGSGKTLAMALPALFGVFWSGRDKGGCCLTLVPSRELATQHAALASRLVGEEATVVTSSTTTAAQLDAVCEALATARCVVATPRELCAALEHQSRLYVTLAARVEALVLDELDLLVPARKSQGAPVTRWQDRGTHPAEALVKLIARRSTERLQVLAGSATLDKAAKAKLERCLKGSKRVPLPLRVVSLLERDAFTLTTKMKRVDTMPTVRTTMIPTSIAHAYVPVPKSCSDDDLAALLVRAVRAARPSAGIVFVCNSYGLKVRAVDAALRAAGLRSDVLSDVLWPASARNRRRAAHRRVRRGQSDDRDQRRVDDPARLTDDASAALNARFRRDEPSLVVADEAVSRGLHLDAVDTVFILGRPANADTYLHLAGRTARDPLTSSRRADVDALGAKPTANPDATTAGTVVTLLKPRDLNVLRSWVANLGASEPFPFPLDPSDTSSA